MAAYEQHIEVPDKKWQYLLFAAEPYETIAFKIPSREIDKGSSDGTEKGTVNNSKFWTHWNPVAKQFFLQLTFKMDAASAAAAAQAAMVGPGMVQFRQPVVATQIGFLI